MKKFLLLAGALAVGLAAACLAAVLMMLPARLEEQALQNQRPPAASPAPAPEPQPEAPPEPTAAPLPLRDFSGLLARNPDVVGWITIDGTPMDYPVVQGRDNTFYLRHGLDREYDNQGIPFADYECDVQNGRHLILYGHNMGVGRSERFSSLQNYRDPGYYAEHPVIQYSTPGESLVYKIVGVYALSSRSGDPDYFAFNEYVDFADDDAEQAYLDQVSPRCFYTAGDFVRPDERLLTLCLCTYEMADARLLVMARPLRPGESPDADSVTVNETPQLPARWPTR